MKRHYQFIYLRFFILLMVPLISAEGAYGQTTAEDLSNLRVSGNYQNKDLSLVLLDLSVNHRLTFHYDREELPEKDITISFRRRPLSDVLTTLLDGTGLTYELIPPRTIRIVSDPAGVPARSEQQGVAPTRRDITVSGVVQDMATGERLPFANVVLAGTDRGTTTNVDGYFTLFDVPDDTTVLTISHLGYQPLSFQLHPQTQTDDLRIGLRAYGVELSEVVVAAHREEQMIQASTGISQIGITPAALGKLPSFGEKDIFRSLQLLPGISGSNESSSGLFIRGGTPDQNLILFDGFTVYHVDHLFGVFSAFNANALKDLQLYKGGFEAKYGGRLSSVVDMTGKDGNTETFNIGGGLSLLSANAYAEGPFADGKGSFLIAGRRSFQSGFYNDLFDTFTESGNQASPNETSPPQSGRFASQEVEPNSYFYDLNAKVTYRPSSKDVFSLSFFNGQDNLDNSQLADQNRFGGNFDFTFNRETIDLTDWGNWGSSLKWSHRWNDQWYTNANISYSNYYSQRDRSISINIERNDSTINRNTGTYEYNDLRDFTLRLDNEWKLSQNSQFDFGLQATFQDIQYDFTQNDTLTVLDRQNTGWTTSLYAQYKHTIRDKWILQGGLRSTYYTPSDGVYLEPRASFTYLFSDRWKGKAAWGTYYQFATRIVREDIQQGSRDFWLLADNQQVPIGSATHYIAGLSYETPDYLLDVEGYYKSLSGLSEYTTRLATQGMGPNRTLSYEELFYQGTGTAKGIEFLAQKKTGRLNGWIGYTLGRVVYDFPAFGENPFPANQDQTHELKIVGSYNLNRWTFGANFIYATGRPYTAPVGYYQLTLVDGETADFFEISDKNALRFDDYHRFDISATYAFDLFGGPATLGLSIYNLYNRQNTWYKEFDVVEGELLETDVSLLDMTPSLFFTWSLR